MKRKRILKFYKTKFFVNYERENFYNILFSYGSTYLLARKIEKGAPDKGPEVRLRRVQETIPEKIWKNLKGVPEAKEMQKDVSIATIDDLVWADGIVLSSPTRFGICPDK